MLDAVWSRPTLSHFVAALAWFVALPSAAQDIHADFRRGRELVRLAADRLRVDEGLHGAPTIRVDLRGAVRSPEQAYEAPTSAGTLPSSEAFSMSALVDFAQERLVLDQHQDILGGLRLRFTTGFHEGSVWSAARHAGTHTEAAGSFEGVAVALRPWVPWMVVRSAVKVPMSLRFVGTSDIDPGADVVELSVDASTRDRLHVERETGYPVALERLVPDRLLGSDRAVFRYLDWVDTPLPHPGRVVVERHWGDIVDMTTTAFAPAAGPEDDAFRVPDGSRRLAGSPEAVSVAQGVWEVRGLGGGLYRAHFFEAGDGLVAFEAPVGLGASRTAVRLVQEATGGKRVTHVVLSHFHLDHTAGLRAFTDLGAAVVTTADNVELVRRLAAVDEPFAGVRDAPAAPEPTVIAVEPGAPLVVGSGNDAVRVHHVGPTPHVASMLVLHDPESGALADGDLFSRLSLFNETFAGFVDWIDASGLDVSLVVGTHHEPVEVAELEAMALAWRAR